eukprot:67631-Chlamydomonas_euryale.AAC.5
MPTHMVTILMVMVSTASRSVPQLCMHGRTSQHSLGTNSSQAPSYIQRSIYKHPLFPAPTLSKPGTKTHPAENTRFQVFTARMRCGMRPVASADSRKDAASGGARGHKPEFFFNAGRPFCRQGKRDGVTVSCKENSWCKSSRHPGAWSHTPGCGSAALCAVPEQLTTHAAASSMTQCPASARLRCTWAETPVALRSSLQQLLGCGVRAANNASIACLLRCHSLGSAPRCWSPMVRRIANGVDGTTFTATESRAGRPRRVRPSDMVTFAKHARAVVHGRTSTTRRTIMIVGT